MPSPRIADFSVDENSMHTAFMNAHTVRLHMTGFILGLLIAAGCASQRPPEGGPVDSEPPTIIATTPGMGSTRVEGREVTLEFSEYVQRQSFLEAVHISPLQAEPPAYEWSGKEVTLIFADTLQSDRTYVITVGTKVRDINASNPLAETFHLAFSTGDSLDRGTFNGSVIDEKPAGISIFAYLLTPGRADTLDIKKDRPDYLVQSADDGSFHFYNVTPGTYRVFAVRDKINNVRYDVESDAIGIPFGDIEVRDSIPPEPALRFLLHTEDTTRPSIQRIEALNAQRVRLKFNETVYPQPLPLSWIHITDSLSGARLPLIDVLTPANERYAWDVFTGTPLPSGSLLLTLDSLHDGAFNPIAVPDSGLNFIGQAAEDTTRPAISHRFPTARARNVEPDSMFVLSFDRPMSRTAVLRLEDSTGTVIPLSMQWASTTELRCAHAPLLDEAVYSFCADLTSLKDSISGRSVGDSVYCITFTTGVNDRFGVVAGSVRSDDSTGTFIVRIREAKKDGALRRTQADSSGNYRFERILEGRYLIDAYRDENGNQRFDYGKAAPFTPPEPYGMQKDTLRVRARWETNGVIVPIRR